MGYFESLLANCAKLVPALGRTGGSCAEVLRKCFCARLTWFQKSLLLLFLLSDLHSNMNCLASLFFLLVLDTIGFISMPVIFTEWSYSCGSWTQNIPGGNTGMQNSQIIKESRRATYSIFTEAKKMCRITWSCEALQAWEQSLNHIPVGLRDVS